MIRDRLSQPDMLFRPPSTKPGPEPRLTPLSYPSGSLAPYRRLLHRYPSHRAGSFPWSSQWRRCPSLRRRVLHQGLCPLCDPERWMLLVRALVKGQRRISWLLMTNGGAKGNE